jgi:hypothetical protein
MDTLMVYQCLKKKKIESEPKVGIQYTIHLLFAHLVC